MKRTIPVVDIFAGPGGLSEGFSSFKGVGKKSGFDIVLSIEKENDEVQTLIVRAIYRLLCQKGKSEIYDRWLASENPSLSSLKQLLKNEQRILKEAEKRVLQFELGNDSGNSVLEERLKRAVGNNKNWILVGGPPCQAYSLVGRVKNNSKTGYNPETDPRFELYKQYETILANYKPAIFLLENVQGILSAKYKGSGVIEQIFNALERNGHYILRPLVRPDRLLGDFFPNDFMIPSEIFGVPQKRHRLVIMGIRSDIAQSRYFQNNQSELFLSFQNQETTVFDMLADLPAVRSQISSFRRGSNNSIFDSLETWIELLASVKKETWYDILAPEMKRTMSRVLKTIAKFNNYKNWCDKDHKEQRISDCLRWIKNDRNDIVQHESRSHMVSDLFRYLFAACYAQVYRKSPKLPDFPEELLPNHANAKSKVFVDRFHVQIAGQPSSTIMSHISKDGHYYIHPDPIQCRSLTVREAARLQTFPDNYFFCGNRTSQFHQVGNAVPPYLAKQIAEIISKIMENL